MVNVSQTQNGMYIISFPYDEKIKNQVKMAGCAFRKDFEHPYWVAKNDEMLEKAITGNEAIWMGNAADRFTDETKKIKWEVL